MDKDKGIRVQVYEADPILWVYNLNPDATDCRQYRVSQEEWDRLAKFEQAYKEIRELLVTIASREEVEFEEAWEEEEEKEREGRDGQAKAG